MAWSGATLGGGLLKARIDLSNVAEMLLITLHFWAVESQRPDALVKDEQTVALMNQIDYDFSRCRSQLFDLVPTILRACQFDRHSGPFWRNTPTGSWSTSDAEQLVLLFGIQKA